MTAIGRALMARPTMILLDEPSMGLAPQIVEEIFEIVRDLNAKERVSFLLAEQNTMVALRYANYGYILENGRVVMDGEAKELAQQRGREGVLPRAVDGGAQELPRRQALSPAQALAGVSDRRPMLVRRLAASRAMNFDSLRKYCATLPGATRRHQVGRRRVLLRRRQDVRRVRRRARQGDERRVQVSIRSASSS